MQRRRPGHHRLGRLKLDDALAGIRFDGMH
jgi:hypothetical protein